MHGKPKLVTLLLSALFVAYGLVGGLLMRVSAGDEAYRDLSLFTSVLERIRQDYVEQPDMEKALKGALHGMMEAMDPYSSFVDAETYFRLRERNEQAGIGVSVSKRYGYGYIVGVMENSAAQKSGLRTGDLIESVDGKPTALMSLWEVNRAIGGDPGTMVTIRVIRSRRSEPMELTMKREKLEVPKVKSRVVEGELGLLRIPHMNEGVSGEVLPKLKMLVSLDIKGLVVDIRGASGGSLDEAVAIANFFLPKESTILSVWKHDEDLEDRVASEDPIVQSIPVVVLVNGATSGPSEVLVAALKDNKVAEVLGERTNGHGSLQERFPLEDGSVLFITTKIFHRPDGEALQGKDLRKSGVKPDIQSPDSDFVTNFYFEKTPDDANGELDDGFYRELDEAIAAEQYRAAIENLHRRVKNRKLEKKAA